MAVIHDQQRNSIRTILVIAIIVAAACYCIGLTAIQVTEWANRPRTATPTITFTPTYTLPTSTASITPTATLPTFTATVTFTPSPSATFFTFTPTVSPTITQTPTLTLTPVTPSLTPTVPTPTVPSPTVPSPTGTVATVPPDTISSNPSP